MGAGAEAPRQVSTPGGPGAWSPALDAARQSSRDLPAEEVANGGARGESACP